MSWLRPEIQPYDDPPGPKTLAPASPPSSPRSPGTTDHKFDPAEVILNPFLQRIILEALLMILDVQLMILQVLSMILEALLMLLEVQLMVLGCA